MASDTAGVPITKAKVDSRPLNRHKWLSRLSLPAVMLITYSFLHHVWIMVTALVLIVCVALILHFIPTRRAMYACSLAVLIFTAVFTLGIVGHAETVPGTVTTMWSQGEEYGVGVTYGGANGDKVMAVVRKGDFYRMQEQWKEDDQYSVELTYRTQSVLGISSLPPLADAIDSKLVISDYRAYLRGGITGRVVLPLTVVLGVVPLAYLVYKDRENLLTRRSYDSAR
jgi:hypothetical protein